MNSIHVLDSGTIDKIAAGEVVERPASVIKELVENAMDAGATSISVEIKDGGISYIRVTDNGKGMNREELQTCFLRHATSKISDSDDLNHIQSLGFRGEALSSISAVSKVEAITKTPEALVGNRLCIEGGKVTEENEVGAPTGTTFVIRQLFYNTPARRKFLKSERTETSAISDLISNLALSRPDVAFQFINQGVAKLQTNGNNDLREVIYRIYGLQVSKAIIPVSTEANGIRIEGYIGKPELVRGSRTYETYFVNGRFVKNPAIAKGVEDGCRQYLMQHKFPFCVLHIEVKPEEVDVNVHPSKMEIRFHLEQTVFETISSCIAEAMKNRDMIAQVGIEPVKSKIEPVSVEQKVEPFEHKHAEEVKTAAVSQATVKPVSVKEISPLWEKFRKNTEYKNNEIKPATIEPSSQTKEEEAFFVDETEDAGIPAEIIKTEETASTENPETEESGEKLKENVQMSLFEEKILTQENKVHFRIVGQVFDTYWLIEFENKLLMIDQHAAHEKVKYERFMKRYREKEQMSQVLYPPIIVSLSGEEEAALHNYCPVFQKLGYVIEEFGGREHAIREVPTDLYGCNEKELFLEVLDELVDKGVSKDPEVITDKIASMSCKAAVKGNNRMEVAEAKALIEELLTLENPYNCPHGRPTIVSMTKYEMDRKFKRIVD